MPRYKCHKEVWALKIKQIDSINVPAFDTPVCRGSTSLGSACRHCERCIWYARNPHISVGGAVITPEDAGYSVFEVSGEYMEKHNPAVGGYYVVYKDGYKSYSPADAFEDGYARMN